MEDTEHFKEAERRSQPIRDAYIYALFSFAYVKQLEQDVKNAYERISKGE